jgi:hypothetical protein
MACAESIASWTFLALCPQETAWRSVLGIWRRFRQPKALAWRLADHRNDAHRDSGKLDGKAVDWLEHVSREQCEACSNAG